MQRIIPFGREYAQSAEFSVDEGQKIRFWLVRQDYTTTVGEADAELQLKSAVGNDNWTTVEVLNDGQPYYDLIGTDENLVYRWVRKAGMAYVAIDRSSDATMSRIQRAPVNARQPDFDAATPVIFKAQIGALADQIGFLYDFQGDAAAPFGDILGTPPDLIAGVAPADSYIRLALNTTSEALEIEVFEDIGDGSSNIDWSEYEGGQIGIATECDDLGAGTMNSTSWNITAGDISTNGIQLEIADAAGDATLLDWIVEGKTLFVFIMKPGQIYPVINLGPKTGRFMLDENDIPARLSAWPFDTSNEDVALSLVEGSVVIPTAQQGDQIVISRDDNTYVLLEGPGEYEWERSCNSSPGVYLNTGWRV